MKEAKWKYILFCFHPKFDTGTWTVAFAFTTLVIHGAGFIILLAFSVPDCCPASWDQLAAFSPTFKAIYSMTLLCFLAIVLLTGLGIQGTFKSEPRKMVPYLLTSFMVEIFMFSVSILAYMQLAHNDKFLLFDNRDYWNLAKTLIKDDLADTMAEIWENVNVVLKNALQLELGRDLNWIDFNAILETTLKKDLLDLIGAFQSFLKTITVFLVVGLNWLFITNFLVAFSHWTRLRSGVVSGYVSITEAMKPSHESEYKSKLIVL